MAYLLISTLLLYSIHIVLGTPVLDFYLPSPREAPNVFRLECHSVLDGDSAVPDALKILSYVICEVVLIDIC